MSATGFCSAAEVTSAGQSVSLRRRASGPERSKSGATLETLFY